MTPVYAAVVLVVLYPLLSAFLLRVTQGTRDEMADIGRELLASPAISEDNKQFISDLLEDVFDWRFMAVACLSFPQMVWDAARGRSPTICAADRQFVRDARVNRFFDLHWRAVAAASPAWTALFLFIAFATMLIAVCFVGFSLVNQLWIDTAHHVAERVQPSAPLYRYINDR